MCHGNHHDDDDDAKKSFTILVSYSAADIIIKVRVTMVRTHMIIDIEIMRLGSIKLLTYITIILCNLQ